ncbi:MAG: glycosyltransferase family 9 protein [Acidobacteriota bacterium]
MKALIIRLSSIGDVVHTLPTLAALQQHGWEAGWIVEPASSVLLGGNPALEQMIAAPAAKAFRWSEALAAVRAARERRYDAALDFQGLWKSAAWARFAGARRVIGFDRPWRKEPASALLIGERADLPLGRDHVIDKNLALLGPLGIEATGLREFPLPSSAAAVARVDVGLNELGVGEFAILNPAGGWESKLWPAERFGEAARGLRERGLRSIVTWGPGEGELADRVVASSGGAAVRSFPTTLLDYAELARRARLVIAADTGPLHLACAVKTPVVALFGPTDPARNGPFDPADEVIRRTPPCAPCYRRGCTRHVGIMEEIPAAEVLDAAERRLASAREG